LTKKQDGSATVLLLIIWAVQAKSRFPAKLIFYMAKNKIGDAFLLSGHYRILFCEQYYFGIWSNIIYPHKICLKCVLRRSLHNYQIEGVLTITNATNAMKLNVAEIVGSSLDD
jgi:hypothetical protein